MKTIGKESRWKLLTMFSTTDLSRYKLMIDNWEGTIVGFFIQFVYILCFMLDKANYPKDLHKLYEK